jgi:UPF0489 domain
MPCEILCGVVDDHSDIVPFLQAAWRAKKIPFQFDFFLHFDSHADLGLPSSISNVKDFSNSTILLDKLNEPSGISEFILPLVYNGHFNRIYWIHPPDIDAIYDNTGSNGILSYLIGNCARDQIVGVTLQHPYYFDDGLVYAAEDLTDVKEGRQHPHLIYSLTLILYVF